MRAVVVQGDSILVMHRLKFGLEYFTLVGGGVEMGESDEQALHRELTEETGIVVDLVRPIYFERAGAPYGDQVVFLCNYVSGDAKLSDTSDERKITSMGKNIYEPGWLKISHLADVSFRSEALKARLIQDLKNGFPDKPITL